MNPITQNQVRQLAYELHEDCVTVGQLSDPTRSSFSEAFPHLCDRRVNALVRQDRIVFHAAWNEAANFRSRRLGLAGGAR